MMKKSIRVYSACVAVVAAALAAAVLGCAKKGGAGEHYGEPFTQAPAVTISQLLETPDAFSHQAVRVKGKIERQCPMAGCWFFINDGQGHSIKVELGDYLPKLPQKFGHLAEVEGEWIKKGTAHEFIGTRVTFD
mgnify:CR=1 FL=1